VLAGAYHPKWSRRRGFSLLELTIVLGIICVIAAMSYPSLQAYLKNYRVAGDAKRIASQIALARMRSAGDFNQERVNIDQTGGTFEMDACTKSTGVFTNENGAVFPLSAGVSFGYGNTTTPANPNQPSIAQTPSITFNSRGIPINLTGVACSNGCSLPPVCTATATGNNAIYLAGDGSLFYAVTVNIVGKIDVWRYVGSTWQKAGY
jgi:prepilin-type N-terminal cleavage/methylation domain-containing protein